MICMTKLEKLSLIFVPLLTLVFIVGIILLLLPKNRKNRAFVLSKSIIMSKALLSLPKISQKNLKTLFRHFKVASRACSELSGEDFYELERVFVKVNECYKLILSIIHAKVINEFDTFKARITKDVDESISIMQDLSLIPEDINKYEDDVIKKAKEIFSAKYKTEKAKKYLKSIKEQEEDKNPII